MKNLKIYFIMILISAGFVVFNSCSKELDQDNFENNDTVLTASELVLKEQMAEAAKIVAEIAKDADVLNEIITTIGSQPKIFEDRVKFSQLMNSELKSSINNYRFNSFFTARMKNTSLKSANNLIEDLIKNEVEFNIPYPIEDYPDGTDIIITSHPMDNLDENIGYFVSSGEEVIVNMETTETYPVIIVWPSTISYNEIVKASTEESMNSAKNLNKQESGNNLKAASTTYITDMTNWNREDLGHMIKIRYIYVKDDHRTGLFAPNSIVYLSTASVEFDSSTKITYKVTGTGNALSGVFSKTILPKWVRWAEDGYSKGWIDVGEQIVFSDWQPAITNSTFAGWVDRPNKEGESKVDLTAIVKVIIALISPELAVLNAFSDEMITYTKTQTAVADVVYGQVPMTRNAYKYLYNSAGTTWGEVGEKTFPVSGYGQRPALQINSDLLYITTWETFPIN